MKDMKKCPVCHSEVEDQFDLCWQCNYSFEKGEVVEIVEEGESELECLRCGASMRSAGNYDFREGFFIETIKSLDMYVCPRCGKVELYLPDKKLEKYRRTGGGLTGRI